MKPLRWQGGQGYHRGVERAEVPDLQELVQTPTAVHLIFRVDRDWQGEREQAVAEAEDKVARLGAYLASPAFRQRHGKRTGVLRMRTPAQPPSIVIQVLQERGVEVEAEDRPRAEPGQRCDLCGREGLWEDQVTMTGQGWGCPSCARAWARQQEPPPRPPGRLQRLMTGRTLSVALVLLLLLCLFGLYWTLDGMQHMNQVIRAHLPS